MINNDFFNNKGPFTLGQIAEQCDAELLDITKKDVEVSGISAMGNAKSGQICSFYDRKAKAKAAEIKATACITSENLADALSEDVVVLVSKNPKESAWKLSHMFYGIVAPKVEISKNASIHKTAKIGKNCSIADFVVIEENAIIGDNVIIESNSKISRFCEIGDNSIISSNVTIAYTKMGQNCQVSAGTRIGQEGFGYITIAGQHKRVPQLGSVILGNNVEIGSNVCIDRGSLTNTVIGDGTVIDNLVQIAHGVTTGKGCIVVAGAGIAGSSKLEDYVVIGPQVGVIDHVNIGTGAQVVAMSGVMKDLNAGEVVIGIPALPIKEGMKLTAMMHRMVKKQDK